MKTIQELETFFELDLKVKKLIESADPKKYIQGGSDAEKGLLSVLETAKNALIQMTILSGLNVDDVFKEQFDKIEKKVKDCTFDIKKLKNIYENDILKFTVGLEESLEQNIHGHDIYKIFGRYMPLKYCNTVNDMLHYLHFYVLNDDETLESMNVIDKKLNESEEWSILYGKESKEARDIYDNLPNGKREGQIDVVSFDNHVLLMIRDVGHALTIDVQTNEKDKYRVNYFIPKICNVNMVNELPGVKKVSENSDTTHGEFEVEKENLGKEIANFISKVPTDADHVSIFESTDFANLSKEERDKIVQRF